MYPVPAVFVRVKTFPNSERRTVQIVECYRSGEKVLQRIIRHVGTVHDEAEKQKLVKNAEEIRQSLVAERERTSLLVPPVPLQKDLARPSEHNHATAQGPSLASLSEERRVSEGVVDVFGRVFDQLRFNTIFDGRRSQSLKAAVLARVEPTASVQHEQVARMSYVDCGQERVFRMMEALETIVGRVHARALEASVAATGGRIETMFVYSVAIHDNSSIGAPKPVSERAQRAVGDSVLVACTSEGLPIGFKLTSGSETDVDVLLRSVDDWKASFDVRRVVVVADHSMKDENVPRVLLGRGLNYVFGCPLRSMPARLRSKLVDSSDYRLVVLGDEVAWFNEKVADSESGPARLCGFYSPKEGRKLAEERERIIVILEKIIEKRDPSVVFRGDSMLAIGTYSDYFEREGTEVVPRFCEAKLRSDAQWDGMYGIVANSAITVEEMFSCIRGLWNVESYFRFSERDLQFWSAYSNRPLRLRARLALCFLAFCLVRHFEKAVRERHPELTIDDALCELHNVQASVLRDDKTGRRFRLPSPTSALASEMYSAVGLRRDCTAKSID